MRPDGNRTRKIEFLVARRRTHSGSQPARADGAATGVKANIPARVGLALLGAAVPAAAALAEAFATRLAWWDGGGR